MNIQNIFKRSEPILAICLVAVPFDKSFALIVEASEVIQEVFDGPYLEDNLTDMSNVPKEPGVYKCLLSYHAYRSNHPQDPVEWDADIFIKSYDKLDI